MESDNIVACGTEFSKSYINYKAVFALDMKSAAGREYDLQRARSQDGMTGQCPEVPEVRTFLGFTSYFSKLAVPLTRLLLVVVCLWRQCSPYEELDPCMGL